MEIHEHYWKLSEMEERYNASAGGIRALASAWILAALGASGALLVGHDPASWPLPLGFLIIVVMTLGVIGMVTLWVMDQLVFHRLLSSVFVVGLKIEKDNPDIPPLRSMMMKTQEGLGTHRWERLFYLGPTLVFAVISLVVLVGGWESLFSSSEGRFATYSRQIGVVFVLLQCFAIGWVIAKLPVMGLRARAAHFQDPEFAELFPKEDGISRFETVIARFRSKPGDEDADKPHEMEKHAQGG
ncbi:MAG: hypothetical protein MUC79_15685 [Thiobacillaceae bacterium]|jgi:hypothetical protein|nr:hypothetical protein [Thiobacillaceae bacterium]